ncbi:Na(+)/H(+) antiporter subunit G [Oligella sp. MSHR50489EDL]|uniref:monovalent cation/H(+) antiporter subunit G n=1 Tax=Oligella sp. MSHR50489EDL TaxID=3139409 RepID=UPI003D8177AB
MTQEIPLWIEIIASILIILSGLVTLIGNFGLLNILYFRKRIHAPTLGNSLGLWFLMVASMLVSYGLGDRLFFHEMLVVIFIFLTSPISWTLLMRSYVLKQARQDIEDH